MDLRQSILDAIEDLPENLRSSVRSGLSERGVLDAESVKAITDAADIEVGHLMIMLLPVAAAYARVPISGFHVGAVALGMPPGSLYLGANMEYTGQALSFGIHGEQSATNNAWLNGEKGLQALAINAAPCGYCRQYLYEITTATKGFNILLKKNSDPKDYSYTVEPLTHYLPDAFGPQDLGIKGGLMEAENHGLSISSSNSLALQALGAANASYSPYTFDYAGVAIQLGNGTVYTGRYSENAAYNPSLSPLECALSNMNLNEPMLQQAYDIVAAALVEPSSKASQLGATTDVLSSVAPGVQLAHYQAI